MAHVNEITKKRGEFNKQLSTAINKLRVSPSQVTSKQGDNASASELKEAGKQVTKSIDSLVSDLQKVQYFQNFSLGSMLAGIKAAFRSVLSDGMARFIGLRGISQNAPFVTIVDQSGREINFEKLFTGLTRAINQSQLGAAKRKDTISNEVRNETPNGTINSSNKTFTLAGTPRSGKELVYLNGIRQSGGGVDYTLSAKIITFVNAPPTDSILLVDYFK